MFDKELLITVIDRWLSARGDMLSQLEEMNAYTKEESDKFDKNTKRVEELKAEIANNDYVLKNDYLLLAADFDNYKKRTASSEKYAHDKAYEYVITDMLTTYDDLEYLVKELDKRMSPEKMVSATIEDPLQVGVHVIFKNLNKTLTKLGCEKIECTYGDKFDVSTMEAIAVREIQDDEGYDPDDVVEIYRSGWKLNGKVIRPVKVVVGKDKALSEDGTKETKEEKVL